MSEDRRSWQGVRFAPLAPLAFAAASGVVADRYAWSMDTFAWSIVGLVASIVAALAWRAPKLGAWAIVGAFAALGAGWAHYHWSDLARDDLSRADWTTAGRRPVWVRGVPVETSTFRKGEDGPRDRGSTRTVLALTGINEGRGWRACSGQIQTRIVGDRSNLEAGRAVESAGTMSSIEGPLNPGEVDYRPILRARDIRLRLSVDEPSGVWPDPTGEDWPWTRRLGAIRTWSQKTLVDGLDPSVAPLASALLLGRREAVDPEVNDAFARTGTTHLLAISGLHLQVLAVVLGASVRGLGVGRKGTFAVVAIGTIAYAVLVGLAPSVVRSAAMTLGACAAGCRDRYVCPANLLSGAVLATILHNPADLFDIGCQLSFLAVAAIVWLVPAVLEWDEPELLPLDVLERQLEPWWKMLGRMGLKGLKTGVIGSSVIWLAAWPLVSLRFHLVSPVGILINIPLIPLTSLALLLSGLTLVLSAVWAPLGIPFAWACGLCLRLTETIVRWGTAWRWGHLFVVGPSWWWVLVFYLLLGLSTLGLASRWRSSRGWWVLLFTWGSIGAFGTILPEHPETPEAEILAVGHGLAVLVRSTTGQTVLYDCGKMGDPHVGRRIIAPGLWARGVRRINLLILSHADSDHYNGLPDLLDRFEIDMVRVPPGFGGPANPGARALLEAVRKRGIPVESIVDGTRIDLGGGTSLTALHPRATSPTGSTDNARSVVLEVASESRRLLLTGDLEREGLTEVVSRPIEPLDAMLAPHHGGRTSNPIWLYAWSKPSLVVVSQNPLASGSRDPLTPIAEGQFPLLRTWQSGAIRLRWTTEGLLTTGFLNPEPASPLTGVWKAVAIGLGLAFGALFCLFLTVIEWGAWSLVMPGRKRPQKPSEGVPVSATALDGTRLAGVWFANEASGGRTILLLHGLAEDHSALLGRVAPLLRRGWNVATLDARASGESQGRRSTFGARESDDLLAWIEALTPLAGPSPRFAAWGRSMGASTALKAAAADPRIVALILEAPYHDLPSAVASVLRRLRIPLPGIMARLVLIRARMLAGIPLDRPRPIDLALKVSIPTLILHGTNDLVAPILDAQDLARTFPQPAEVYEVTGAGHANVVGIGGDALMDRVGTFLNEALSNRET